MRLAIPDLSAEELARLLREVGAPAHIRAYTQGYTAHDLIQRSGRPDWVVWIIARMAGMPGWMDGVDVARLVLDCVARVECHLPVGDDRPWNALKASRRWISDELTTDTTTVEEAAGAALIAADEAPTALARVAITAVANAAMATAESSALFESSADPEALDHSRRLLAAEARDALAATVETAVVAAEKVAAPSTRATAARVARLVEQGALMCILRRGIIGD